MRDMMSKVLDSDTESEIPASIQSNNNSEPNTDNEEKPETDALPVAEEGTALPVVENGNISDTDSICSNRSSGRLLSNGDTEQLPGPSLPTVRAPTPPAATANGNSSSSCASNSSNPSGHGNSTSNGSTSNPTRVPAAAQPPGAATGDRLRKYRHQNFSKNIYIGTKNAEKWDTLRNLLQFKNDVEFVSFLLRLAEVDDRKRKNRIANGLNGDSDSLQDVLPGVLASSKNAQANGKPSTKKTKRVQFQESVNIINDNSSGSIRTSGGGGGVFDFHEDEDDTENGPGFEFRRRRPRTQQPLRSPLPPGEDGRRDEDAAADGGDEDEEQFIVQNIIKKIPGRVGQGNEVQQDSISSTMGSVSEDSLHTETEVLDYRIAEKIKTELEEKQKLERKSFGEEMPTTSSFSEHDRPSDDELYDNKLDIKKVDIRKIPFDPKLGTSRKLKRETGSVDLRIEYEEQEYSPLATDERKPLLPPPKKPRKAPTTKNKACTGCGLKHGTDPCPLNTPLAVINNKIELKEWIEQNEDLIKKHKIVLKPENPEEMDEENEDNYDDDEDDDEGDENEENQYEEKLDIIPSFSETSLPPEFELRLAPLATTISTITPAGSSSSSANQQMQVDASESSCSLAAAQGGEQPQQPPSELPPPTATVTNTINHGLSIYTKIFIPKYTQLGPAIGLVAKETEIQDDCNMRYIYESFDGTKSTYLNMENKNQANWLRYLRPARHRDQKNCVLKVRDEQIVFVTCTDLEAGSELLYWSEESNSAWGKKKMEKTNCGGCNLKFDHPLYYRTHCSVFHDPAFSLTIRKYHCKVCGVAVLGKENIMKHAEKMHDGKGAYQCQFCQKFFLRLNYLEMHRTYGCSMNPQRARPLCDFCGRKFCQPQKLKVHIKRMHSDMAEVLRDFQCKLCSKLLGSRAALQRHSKEVHSRNSAVVSCPRCQKLFQNRSNLKIHMLTHSGVRPFKCAEGECTAAFTTKQCLQFHYKKVHGYAQEQMPKIERSVAYTFDAYSGDLITTDGIQRRQRRKTEPGEEGSSEKRKRAPKDLTGNILKTKNILESFNEICKNDSNLSLLSTKISSILNGNLKDFGKVPGGLPGLDGDGVRKEELDDDLDSNDCGERDERLEAIQRHLNQPLSDEKHEEFSQLHSRLANISAQSEHNAMHYKMPSGEDEKPLVDSDGFGDLNSLANNHKYKEFMNGGNTGLVISKGSKKWISDNDHMQDDNNSESMLAAAANRDFLTKLIMNGSVGHNTSQSHAADDDEDDDDNSTILDVVDSNNQNQQNPNVQNQQQSQQQQQQQQQQHQQQQHQYTSSFAGLNSSLPDLPAFQSHTFPSHFNHQSLLGSFYNNNSGVTGRNSINTIPTSASMLVEAALNSVSNIISEAEMNNSSNENQNLHIGDMDAGNASTAENNLPTDTFNSDGMNSSVDEMKMLKPHNFPLPMNSMSQFSTQSPDDASIIQERAEMEVRPKSRDKLPNYGDGEMLSFESQSHQQQQQSQTALHKHTPSVESVRSALSPEQNEFNYSNSNSVQRQQQQQQGATNSPARSNSRQIYAEHDLISPASTPSLPRYDFGADNNSYARRQEKSISSLALENFEANLKNNHHMQHLSSDEDSSIVIAENLSVNAGNSEPKLKITNPTSGGDFITPNAGSGSSKYDTGRNNLGSDLSTDLRLKYNSEANVDLPDFRSSNSMNDTSDFQGLDMTSRGGLSSSYSHSNFQVPSSGANLNFNRYHHHIYDILNEREQHQHQQQQQQHQQQQEFQLQQQQQQQQQMQHMIQDHIGQDTEPEQPATVDLSRSSNYLVPSPPSPALPYSHPHPDMIRMVSLDLSANSGGNMLVGNTPHHVRHPSFLSSQIQHSNRDSLPDHHRLLASEQLAASNHRLLVDPAAHLIFEQNNRLLAETPGPAPPPPRHVVSPQRGFGAYHHHHHHQVGSSNYHHHSVKQNLTSPPLNQHASAAANYHPFPTYY